MSHNWKPTAHAGDHMVLSDWSCRHLWHCRKAGVGSSWCNYWKWEWVPFRKSYPLLGKKSTNFARVAGGGWAELLLLSEGLFNVPNVSLHTCTVQYGIFTYFTFSSTVLSLLIIWMCCQHTPMDLNSDVHHFCQRNRPQCMVVHFHALCDNVHASDVCTGLKSWDAIPNA